MYHHCCQSAHTGYSSLINHCPWFLLHHFVLLLCLAFDRTSELPPFLRKQLNQLNKMFLLYFFILNVLFLKPSRHNYKSYLSLKMVIKVAHHCYSIRHLPCTLGPMG